MTKLLIATQNQGKLGEFRRLLEGFEIVSTADVGLGDYDVEETGATFAENAILKARAYASASGLYALADDSGLAVDALNGAPGVYSARYGGAGLDDAGRRHKLLEALQHVPDDERTARFVCVIAVADPASDSVVTVEGRCEGVILREERGAGGFGYDRLFLPDGHMQTFGELPHEVKNGISHRGRAMQNIKPLLADFVKA